MKISDKKKWYASNAAASIYIDDEDYNYGGGGGGDDIEIDEFFAHVRWSDVVPYIGQRRQGWILVARGVLSGVQFCKQFNIQVMAHRATASLSYIP